MTTIGIFTAGNGFYAGTLETLTMKAEVLFEPVKKTSAKAPDYKLSAHGRKLEVGAAWNRKSKEGKPYLTVVLDDPSFFEPVSARLIAGDDGKFLLFWNR